MNEPEQSSATRRLYPLHDAEVAEDRPARRRSPTMRAAAVVPCIAFVWFAVVVFCATEAITAMLNSATQTWWDAAIIVLLVGPLVAGFAYIMTAEAP